MWVPAKCNSVRESFSFSLNRPSNKRYCKTIWEYKYTTGQKEYRPEGISDRQRAHAIKRMTTIRLSGYNKCLQPALISFRQDCDNSISIINSFVNNWRIVPSKCYKKHLEFRYNNKKLMVEIGIKFLYNNGRRQERGIFAYYLVGKIPY